MSLGDKLRLLYNLVRSWGPAGRAAVIGGPALVLLATMSLAPARILSVLNLMAVLIVVAALSVGRTMEAVLSSRLEPARDRDDGIGPEAGAGLGRELDRLGFGPARLYRLRQGQNSAFIEARAHQELKVYTVIHLGGRAGPLLKFGSHYDGDRIYIVDNSHINTSWLYPDSVVNDHYPGLGPAELLDVFLRSRPGLGLRPTPPEKFEEYHELRINLMRDHLLSGAAGSGRR